MVNRLGDLGESSAAYRYLGALVIGFAKKSPQNARFILNTLGSMNPTYYQSSLYRPTKLDRSKKKFKGIWIMKTKLLLCVLMTGFNLTAFAGSGDENALLFRIQETSNVRDGKTRTISW